ncbi:DUF47 family protein [Candidatus Micrarchaeota archaeon]|nr:DUF47 family protein [Candidatus Micrarchaeota archaeon]
MGLKEWIIPQDKMFFELLARESENARKASQALKQFMNDHSISEKRSEIKEIEHDNDQLAHEIYAKLNQTLITPLDHEDITRLASLYDDVIDGIYTTVNKMYLFKVKPTPAMKKFAEIITSQVQEINNAMADIRELKKEEMEKSCIEVHKLENDADELLDEEITKLFETKDAIKVMKLKEIYEHLETTTDKCEDVSNALLDIRMKYS